MPFQIFKNLFILFDKNHKTYTLFIFFIFFLLMLLEMFSVTLFIPLIGFVLNMNILENSFYIFFKETFNLDLSFILSDLKTFIIFFAFVFLVKSILIIICNWQKIGFTYKIRKFLTHKIYQKYLNSPYENFIRGNSSKYLKNINYEINIVSEALLHILEFFSEIIVIFGIGIFLLSYNFEVSIIVLSIALIFIYLISFFTKKKIFQLGEKIRILEQFRIQNYLESFNLIKEIKIYNKEDFFVNKDLKFTSDFLQTDFLFRFIKSIPRVLVEFLLIMIFLVLILINMKLQNINYVLEILGVFAASAFRLMPSSNRIVSSFQSCRYALPSINNIVNEFPSKNNAKNKNQIKQKLSNFKNNITFSNVSFVYEESKDYIFKNLNLKISKGKIIGVKGKTGSGKSTVINLISGLIYPTEGSIFIDNINYKDLNINTIHKIIGYVPQNIHLMDTSIRNNISFCSDKISIEDINISIEKANLTSFIEQLPGGIDTIVGEKNHKISGGQAQRIGIARALAKKPSILILDEATNALDLDTEKEIMNGIKKLKGELTIIIISHDDNTLKVCDEIIDLNKELIK